MTQVIPWRIRKDLINRWEGPDRPFKEIYQEWITEARREVIADMDDGMTLTEAISYHTSTELVESPSVIARMIEWRDMATEA